MEKDARNRQGIAAGIVGLVCNLILGAGKLVVGFLTGSVSIVSDAANNLSDAGSGVLTVTSFALGNRAADRDHPFGHGRYEYLAGLLIGVIIAVVGVELIQSSIEKIVSPVAVTYDAASVAVLCASVAVKLGMGVFYRVRAKILRSDTLKAAAFDSFSDCAVTGGLLVTIGINRFIPYPLEGPVGLVISLLIVYGGIRLILGTVNRLLGRGGDKETNDKLRAIVLSDPMIVGCHDLRVHDYGPTCKIASVHAEFDRDLSITDAHGILDKLERRALDELGIELVIHCDPVGTADANLLRLRRAVDDVVRVYPSVSVHDLDIDYNARRVGLHLLAPERMKELPRIREMIAGAVTGVLGEGYSVSVTYDVSDE